MRTHRSLFLTAAVFAAIPQARAQDAEPLVVCATTPNLGALVREVTRGESVEVHVFAKPTQDPHFVRALPSFVKDLSRADLLVTVGLDLEAGWVPALVDQARNPAVRPGTAGYLDASTAIHPLGVPSTAVDRSFGDVHFRGNPHYLVDPVSGVAVAEAIANRLGALQPAWRQHLGENVDSLRRRLGDVVIGEKLATVYDFTKLMRLHQADKLRDFLAAQEDLDDLGGAMRTLIGHRGTFVLVDHDAWRYVTGLFGLETTGFLEPKPGIAPTTSHLRGLVERAQATQPRALIHVPYFDARSIAFVAEATKTPAVTLAHQVGALPGTDDYVSMVRENLTRLANAIGGSDSSGG